MALTLPAAAARLSRTVNETEQHTARAIASAAETMATLSLAQVEVAEAPKGECQLAMLRLQKAAAALVTAQTEMLRAHSQLSDIGQALMSPEEPWCPKTASLEPLDGEETGHLRVA